MDGLKNNLEYNKNMAEDEINLMDYVKVILKRKKLILSWFLGLAIIAGIFSFLMPKVYKIDIVLEIGTIDKTIESPAQLIGRINGDVYGIKVRENNNIPRIEWPKIKTENPKDTNLITMTIESEVAEKAKDILGNINELILAEHLEILNVKRNLIEENIKTTKGKISLTESDIEKIEIQRQSIQGDIQFIKNKIEPVENDIERINAKIISVQEEKESLEAKVKVLQETLVYEQTPGTQFALFDAKENLASKTQEIENLYLRINSSRRIIEDYNLQINFLGRTIENYNSEINSLKIIIEDYNAEANSLRASLGDIQPTKVIKSPTVSETPVSPKKKLNIVIAGILGLFIGVFWAFGKEWWEQNK